MIKSPPFFSIIIAVYNNANGLKSTIESVINQNFTDFELIIIDGGSMDGTQEVINQYSHHLSYWVSEKDDGIYNAWNKAIRQAKGQWISFIGSDDKFHYDALSNYYKYINANNKVEYVSSRVNLARKGLVFRTIGLPWSWPKFLHYMTVAHVGSMHHKNLFVKYGLFDESYKITADYEFLLRARNTLLAGFLNTITADMEVGGVSNASGKAFEESYRAKTQTGGKKEWLAKLEDWEAKCKYHIRRILNK